MGEGDRSRLLGDNGRDGVGLLGDPQPRPVAGADIELRLGLSLQREQAPRGGHPLLDDHRPVMELGAGEEDGRQRS